MFPPRERVPARDVVQFAEDEFTSLFANTFLSWQRVESQLFLIFNTLLPTKNVNLTSAVFHAVMSLDARLGMIDALAHQQLQTSYPELLEEWRGLRVGTKKHAKKRNRLAHFSLHHHSGPDTTKSGYRLRPSIFDVRPTDSDFGAEDLRRFQASFLRLEEELTKHNDRLRKALPR